MIKAIIFDLWETLGTKNIGISKTLRDRFTIEKNSDFLVKYERAIQLKQYESYEALSKSFLQTFDIKPTKGNIDFVSETLQQGIALSTLFEGIYALLEILSRRYMLGILSNTTFFESQAPTNWKINQFFDVQVYSWQLGSLKPNDRNFKRICSELKVSPFEVLFIDDGKENIIAAKKFGLKTIQYKNVEQLKEDLISYDVNVG